jgi:hypothetical protein
MIVDKDGFSVARGSRQRIRRSFARTAGRAVIMVLFTILVVSLSAVFPTLMYRLHTNRFDPNNAHDWVNLVTISDLDCQSKYGDSFGVLSATAGVMALLAGFYNIWLINEQLRLQGRQIRRTDRELKRREFQERDRLLIEMTRSYDLEENRTRRRAGFELIRLCNEGPRTSAPKDNESVSGFASHLCKSTLFGYLSGDSLQTRSHLVAAIRLTQSVMAATNQLRNYRVHGRPVIDVLAEEYPNRYTLDLSSRLVRGAETKTILEIIEENSDTRTGNDPEQMIDGLTSLLRFYLMYLDLLDSGPERLTDYLHESPVQLKIVSQILSDFEGVVNQRAPQYLHKLATLIQKYLSPEVTQSSALDVVAISRAGSTTA